MLQAVLRSGCCLVLLIFLPVTTSYGDSSSSALLTLAAVASWQKSTQVQRQSLPFQPESPVIPGTVSDPEAPNEAWFYHNPAHYMLEKIYELKWLRAWLRAWKCLSLFQSDDLSLLSEEATPDDSAIQPIARFDLIAFSEGSNSTDQTHLNFNEGLHMLRQLALMTAADSYHQCGLMEPVSSKDESEASHQDDDQVVPPAPDCPALFAPPNPLPAEIHPEAIQVLGKIGKGQYGYVKKATLTLGGRCHRIAIKTFTKPDFDNDETPYEYKERCKRAKKKFEREIRLKSKLNHPCIVAYIGHYDRDHKPRLVMELLPFPLSNLVHHSLAADLDPKPFNCIQRVHAAQQALSALIFIFEQGYLFRDLHSGNVRFSDTLTLKLVDFGFVIAQCKSKKWEGDTGYLDPEVAEVPFDERSEVYSFGFLALQIITGNTRASVILNLQCDRSGQAILPPEAENNIYPAIQAEAPECQVTAQGLRNIALACLSRRDQRPSLRETEARLEALLSPPKLESPPPQDESD